MLAICSTGLLVVGLDATIVNIALPAIHRSLGSSLAGLQWTVDAYTLVLASLLILAGSTADRVGRKRVFQLGLVVFSLGSLLCALAPTEGALIAARVLQAIGGSMLSPVAMSIIRTVFVDPAERARRSASTRRCSASASRWGLCSAACWSMPSAGGPSSWSTSRSAPWRFLPPTGSCPSRAPTIRAGSIRSVRCS